MTITPSSGRTDLPAHTWGAFQPLVDAVAQRKIDGFFLRGIVTYPPAEANSNPDAELIPLSVAGGFLFLSPRFLAKRQLSSPQAVANTLQDQTFRFLHPSDAFIVGPNLKQAPDASHFLKVDLGKETHVFCCPQEYDQEVLELAKSIFPSSISFRMVTGPIPPLYDLRQLQPIDAFRSTQGTRPYAFAAVGLVVFFLFITAVVLALQLPILINVIAFIGCALGLFFLVQATLQHDSYP